MVLYYVKLYNVSFDVCTENLYDWKMSSDYEDATNILGLVVFSTVLGVTLGKMGNKGKPLLNFFVSLSEAIMMITGWVIW